MGDGFVDAWEKYFNPDCLTHIDEIKDTFHDFVIEDSDYIDFDEFRDAVSRLKNNVYWRKEIQKKEIEMAKLEGSNETPTIVSEGGNSYQTKTVAVRYKRR